MPRDSRLFSLMFELPEIVQVGASFSDKYTHLGELANLELLCLVRNLYFSGRLCRR